MIAYKFLERGRIARFSGREWPKSGWLETEGELRECRNGIHACRVEDLSYWLGEELWEVELAGKVIPGKLKLVAERGRLGARVDGWDDVAQAEFARECVRRVAKHASDELREAGVEDDADALGGAPDIDAIAAAAAAAAKAAEDADARVAERLAGYAADAVAWATEYPPSGVAFVAAYAAQARSNHPDVDPFAAERAEQARWLADRLVLSRDGA